MDLKLYNNGCQVHANFPDNENGEHLLVTIRPDGLNCDLPKTISIFVGGLKIETTDLAICVNGEWLDMTVK